MDLTNPAGVEDFVRICLHGRRKRTPEKFVEVLPPYLADAIAEHAPAEVVEALRADQEQRRKAAEARALFVERIAGWIGPDPEEAAADRRARRAEPDITG